MEIDLPLPTTETSDSILESFAQISANNPFKTAICSDNQSITYHELDTKTNRLARHLNDKGVGRGHIIAVLLEPGIELIIGLLGILKSGAAYVPLSADHPAERLRQIMQITQSPLLLSDKLHSGIIERSDIEMLLLDEVDFLSANTMLPNQISGDDLAYVLFTSGSTGTPKGVKVLHRNLMYYTSWTVRFFHNTIRNKLPLTSESHFAAAVSQIYSCLCSGSTLHIVPKSLNNPEKLLKWYLKNPEYGLYCVPSVWNLVTDWLKNRHFHFIPPKALFLSGEDIPEQLIIKTKSMFPDLDIWNLYGPTEAVANLSYKKIEFPNRISIGSPLEQTSFYVINENGREAGINEQGFLYASGPGICDGYLNDDEQTRKAFFNYMSETVGNIPVYDTGDYVERIGLNEYKFAGRKDQQVKINGQRIELIEIEKVILKHPQINSCIVLLSAIDNSDIIAYLKTDVSIPVSALREFVSLYLPSVMLPVHWIFMKDFPVLANGKTDRKRLPIPDQLCPQYDNDYIRPTTEDEIRLANLFERILKRKGIGIHDNFFHLGGNSLKVSALLIDIEETFSKKLKFQDFFKHPTITSLLPVIHSETENGESFYTKLDDLPEKINLTSNQKSLWFLQKANPENASYNITYRIDIDGYPDTDRLEYAVNKVINGNEVLRSIIEYKDEALYFIPKFKTIKIEIESLEDNSIPNKEEFIHSDITAKASVPFSLANGENLFYFKIYKINTYQFVLCFIVNHLIFDGESMPVFMKQLMYYYSSTGKERIEDVSFNDIAYERSNYPKTEKFDRNIIFWERYLKEVNTMHSFPDIYSFHTKHPFEGGKVTYLLDHNFRSKIENLQRTKNITLPMLLMTAFASTLHIFNPQDEFLIATPFANRLTKKEKSTIGYLSNTLFLHIRFHQKILFSELASKIKSDIIEFLDHQQTPLDILIGILRKNGVQIPLSAFKVLFAYHETQLNFVKNEDISMQATEIGNLHAKCVLHLECFDDNETLKLQLNYNKSKINDSLALHFLRVLKQVLQDAAENFDRVIHTSPSIWPDEEKLIYKYSIGKNRQFETNLTLYHLFEDTSRRYPDLPAINYYGRIIYYHELSEKILRYAAYLKSFRFKAQECIAIYIDHTPEMIIATLAAAALGLPYIPLDPAYPDERIEYILDHAGVVKILTTSEKTINFSQKKYTVIFVDQIPIESGADNFFKSSTKPSDILYIIYTSGTTGNPKGVIVPNNGVANYLLWMKETFRINTTTKILAKTSISFDISIWELFLPLISGGTVILKKRTHLESPEQLVAAINENKVDTIQFVPSGLKLFTDADALNQTPSLTKIFCGGEKMSKKLKGDVLKEFRGELYNLYGPTEASIFMCHYPCMSSGDEIHIPIGRPIYNSEIYVLSDDKKLLPRAIAGDLYIGGEILASGYWKDKFQTEQSFFDISLNGRTSRVYRTGDRGRMLMDGNIEFLGRKDTQIKIRGYRVEAGEVESVLLMNNEIKQAVVFKDTVDENDERLIALIVAEESVDLYKIKNQLRAKLPKFMIPSIINLVSDIPKLPNGKINFKGLNTAVQVPVRKLEYPVELLKDSHIEQKIYTIWTEVIGHDKFSTDDNFFDAGGHSILFLKVKDKIKEMMSADFSIVELYQYPNIKSLAEQYRKKYKNVPSNQLQSIRNRTELKKKRYGK